MRLCSKSLINGGIDLCQIFLRLSSHQMNCARA
ncbi:hypothetical protein T05_666 [Trichinella murrelli]|uniref:Uncharacterized protein n=1 Tax=Trichinella murrelli TaxID=144512 RepID=A0A0V0SR01_9BILA|nr:hypothetical protein T05_666 [Trichinella murrelli]